MIQYSQNECLSLRLGQDRMKQAFESTDNCFRNRSLVEDSMLMSTPDSFQSNNKQKKKQGKNQIGISKYFSDAVLSQSQDPKSCLLEQSLQQINLPNLTSVVIEKDEQPNLVQERRFIKNGECQQEKVQNNNAIEWPPQIKLELINEQKNSSSAQIKRDSNSEQYFSKKFESQFDGSKLNQEDRIKTYLNRRRQVRLNAISLAKKFLNKIKSKSREYLFRGLSEKQFNIINDCTSFYKYYAQNGIIMNFNDTVVRSIWDIFMILFIFYLMIMVPVQQIYSFEHQSFLGFVHNYLIQWILCLELFININSVKFDYQNSSNFTLLSISQTIILILINSCYLLNYQLYSIFRRFIKTEQQLETERQFLNLRFGKPSKLNFSLSRKQGYNELHFNQQIRKDLITLILYYISRFDQDNQEFNSYLSFIVFVKFFDIPAKIQEFEIKLHISDSVKNWMKLIKLEIFVLVLAHVTSCIFLKIGQNQRDNGYPNWIDHYNYSNLSTKELYFTSMYFMVITICTIGYGDISPFTIIEKGFMILVALISTNITAYTFSQISEIVKFEDIKKESFMKLMICINDQMKLCGLGMNLQQKIRKFFEYIHYRDQQKLQLQEQLVDKLPSHLKEELLLELNKQSIQSVQMFQSLSPQCLKAICLSIKQKHLLPDEILTQEQVVDENLYIIFQGNLEVQSSYKFNRGQYNVKKCDYLLKKKDVFGYEGFLLGEQSPYCIQSQGSSIVSYIPKSIFFSILQQYPTDYEKICFIKDKSMFAGCYSIQRLKCISCEQYDHFISKCPYVNIQIAYKPSKVLNLRNPHFSRISRKKRNSLQDLNLFQEQAMIAQAHNDQSVILDAMQYFLQSDFQDDDEPDEEEQSCESNTSSTQPILANQNQVNQQENKKEEHPKLNSQQNSENMSTKKKKQSLSSRDQQDNEEKADSKIQKTISFKIDDKDIDCSQGKISNMEEFFIFGSEKFANNENISKTRENSKQIQDEKQDVKSRGGRSSQKTVEDSPISKKLFLENKISGVSQQDDKLSSIRTSTNKKSYFNSIINKSSVNIVDPEVSILKNAYEQRQKNAEQEQKNIDQIIKERIGMKKQQSLTYIDPHQEGSSKEICSSIHNNLNSPNIMTQRRKSFSINDINIQTKGLVSMMTKLATKNSFPNKRAKKQITKLTSKQKINLGNPLQNQIIEMSEEQSQVEDNQYTKILDEPNIIDKGNLYSTELQIRCKVNLQNLDMLMIRKQYMLMQQKNEIQNYIDLPDNEMDIDLMHDYVYYYKNHNIKYILAEVRRSQEDKIKEVNFINKKKRKFSSKKSPKFNGLQANQKLQLKLNSSKLS